MGVGQVVAGKIPEHDLSPKEQEGMLDRSEAMLGDCIRDFEGLKLEPTTVKSGKEKNLASDTVDDYLEIQKGHDQEHYEAIYKAKCNGTFSSWDSSDDSDDVKKLKKECRNLPRHDYGNMRLWTNDKGFFGISCSVGKYRFNGSGYADVRDGYRSSIISLQNKAVVSFGRYLDGEEIESDWSFGGYHVFESSPELKAKIANIRGKIQNHHKSFKQKCSGGK